MTAKHTPGPWFTGKKPHGHCRIYAQSEAHAIARTYGPELNGIGVCSLTGPEKEADAKLIAAAPELLDALILADAMLSGANMNANVVEKKVRAAIAKATGEAA